MTEKHSYDERGFGTDETSGDPPVRRSAKGGGGFLEFLIILLVAFALVFGFVRPFVMEAFYIPSESMLPTLKVGDRVFVNKFVYRFWEPGRGDVIVFESVEGENEDLIKRVVALPGDEVTFSRGVLRINGEAQEEPYVNERRPDRETYVPTIVPEGHVFAMGDNRANSRDSRFFGPVPVENIEGEAFASFWPPSRVGLL